MAKRSRDAGGPAATTVHGRASRARAWKEGAVTADIEFSHLLAVQEPVVSLYLRVADRVEDVPGSTARRWRGLRGDLMDAGVGQETLAGLDEAVAAARVTDAGLAAF